MENYILNLSSLSSAFIKRLGVYYYLLPLTWLLILFALVIVGTACKKFRYADKKIFTSLTLSVAFSHTAMAINSIDFNYSRFLWLSMLAFALSFALCGVLTFQSDVKIRLTMREKRLIGKLSAKNCDSSAGIIRRVEFVENEGEKKRDIEPNLNEIASIIGKLRREELTPYEEDELDKTEMDIEKFSVRPPTPFERRILSDRLLKIVKMTSKYNVG